MKKLVSFLCVAMLLVMSVFPVSAANDGDDTQFNSTEMLIKRINADLSGKSEEETAKEILKELGMTENLIKGVNEEYLDMVYNAKSISADDQYGKVNSEGEVTLLSDAEFAEENSIRNGNNSGISTLSLEGETEDEISDSLFNKSLYVIETRNAPAGTMGLICSFVWIDEPFYRCWDVVAISGTNLEFDEESAFLAVAYDEQIEDLLLADTTVNSVLKEFDFSDLEREENIIYSGDFVGTKFDVPADVYTPTMLWMYNNIGVVLMASTVITYPQQVTNFTVTGWYFHQTVGFESDVSISGDGLSLSISPALLYDDPHQIQLTPKYIP